MTVEIKNKCRRYDKSVLRSPVREPNGWLRFDALPTRVGVFEYLNADGSVRRELRLPEHVFAPQSLASFHMVPLTNDHPDEALTADNTAKYQRGSIGSDVRQDGEHVRVSGLVTDAALVRLVEEGKTELSCGYDCDLLMAPGEWRGVKYDAVQTNIRGNHIAVVDRGRAGPTARINMDSAAAFMVRRDTLGAAMEETIKIGDQEFKVTKEVADKIRNMLNGGAGPEVAAPMADKVELEKKADRLAAERDELRRKLDGFTSKEAEAKRKLDAAEERKKYEAEFRARLDLEGTAREVLGEKYKMDGKTDREIRLEVIQHFDSKFDGKNRSDEYIAGKFDTALETARDDEDEDEPAILDARRKVDAPDEDNEPAQRSKRSDKNLDEHDRRDRMMEANRNAHKTPSIGMSRQ